MKLSINEEILTKAHQYHYARRSSMWSISNCLVEGHFLIFCVILIVIGTVREELNSVMAIFLGVSVVAAVLDPRLRPRPLLWVFRAQPSKRAVRKLFALTDAIDVEINWSDDEIEIKYGTSAKTLEWEDFKGWLETNGLLLLYRRKKFVDIEVLKLFDVIDMSQISEEERASFTGMLETKVKNIT